MMILTSDRETEVTGPGIDPADIDVRHPHWQTPLLVAATSFRTQNRFSSTSYGVRIFCGNGIFKGTVEHHKQKHSFLAGS